MKNFNSINNLILISYVSPLEKKNTHYLLFIVTSEKTQTIKPAKTKVLRPFI